MARMRLSSTSDRRTRGSGDLLFFIFLFFKGQWGIIRTCLKAEKVPVSNAMADQHGTFSPGFKKNVAQRRCYGLRFSPRAHMLDVWSSEWQCEEVVGLLRQWSDGTFRRPLGH
jgi:hypothetical protein